MSKIYVNDNSPQSAYHEVLAASCELEGQYRQAAFYYRQAAKTATNPKEANRLTQLAIACQSQVTIDDYLF